MSDYAYGSATIELTVRSTVATGLRFPEGPIACDDGSVLVCEIAAERIVRIRPLAGGGWSDPEIAAVVPGGPNGAAVGPDGALYVCNNGGCFSWREMNGLLFPGPVPAGWTGGSIDRIDLSTGERTVLYRAAGDVALRAPNDLVFDAHGGFWFTDHGVRLERTSDRTGIYYAKADGSHIAEVVFPVDGPNGIGLSPAGDRVYWAETHSGRVFQRPITAPGVAGPAEPENRGLLIGLPGMILLDSLAVDAEGNVCVATLGPGGVTAITPGGVATHVSLAGHVDPLTTNLCFGGPDHRTAFVTLSGTGRVIEVEWPVPGAPLAHTN
jgi:gluconolactonase